jgi:hypothetical protein
MMLRPVSPAGAAAACLSRALRLAARLPIELVAPLLQI